MYGLTDEQKQDLLTFVAALRSGEYKQTTGGLCSISEDGETCFCAAGVACDIFKEGAKWEVSKFGFKWLNLMGCTASPPPLILERLPIDWDWLVDMNDKEECDFIIIADRLERKYL